jgi:hypothetical protein
MIKLSLHNSSDLRQKLQLPFVGAITMKRWCRLRAKYVPGTE